MNRITQYLSDGWDDDRLPNQRPNKPNRQRLHDALHGRHEPGAPPKKWWSCGCTRVLAGPRPLQAACMACGNQFVEIG
jgi:hypothetical protein